MKAGIGQPPKGFKTYINTSRLLTVLDCEQSAYDKYVLGIASTYEAPALSLGLAWHSAIEFLAEGWTLGTALDIGKRLERKLIDEAFGAKDEEKRIREASWLRKALPFYVERFPEPPVNIIASELPIWLEIDGTCFMGRLDAVGMKQGFLWNLELKTQGPTVDVEDFFAQRAKSLQDSLYGTALNWICENEPTLLGLDLDTKFAGTYYSIAKKVMPYKKPKQFNKDGSVSKLWEKYLENEAGWASRLFFEQEIWYDEEYALSLLDNMKRGVATFDSLPNFIPQRNPSSCVKRYGKCLSFGKCWNDWSAEDYGKREPDYVDEMRKQ